MLLMLLLTLLVGISIGGGGAIWFMRRELAHGDEQLRDKQKIEELEALVIKLTPTANWERQFSQEERR